VVGYFCYGVFFLFIRNTVRYFTFLFFCIYIFTLLRYSHLFLIKLSYADFALPSLGFKSYVMVYWISTFITFLNNESHFVLSNGLRRTLKIFNCLNHLLLGNAFLKAFGLVDSIEYLNNAKCYAGALTLYTMPSLSHFLKITAANPNLSAFNSLADQEKISAWETYKVGNISIQEHVMFFTEATEARILASELSVKTLQECVLRGEQKAFALETVVSSLKSEQAELQNQLMYISSQVSSQGACSVTSSGYFWPSVIIFGCGVVALLVHNEINPMSLLQNF
jgi:hypothetical protein